MNSHRMLLAVTIAPIAGAFVAVLCASVYDMLADNLMPRPFYSSPRTLFAIALASPMISYPVTIILGIPFTLMYERLGFTAAWPFLLIGALLGFPLAGIGALFGACVAWTAAVIYFGKFKLTRSKIL